MAEDFELFISHASEDKPDLVRRLADRLRHWGIKVWYDEYSLSPGDSLSRSLDNGLARTRYGLVVISKSFLRKPWTEYELRGLTAKETYRGDKVIIPIWHGVSEVVGTVCCDLRSGRPPPPAHAGAADEGAGPSACVLPSA
jgi:hypothetical protein